MRVSPALPVVLALCAACRTAPVTPELAAAPAPAAPTAAAAEVAPAPAPPPEPSPYARDDVALLRLQAEETLRRQAEMYWKSWVFGAEPDLGTAYEGKDALYSAASVKLLRDAAAQAKGDDARALASFALYVAGEVAARETAPLEDQIAALENAATVQVGDAEHAWRDLDEIIAAEPNAQTRAKLYASELAVMVKVAPLVLERDRRFEAAAKELGWASAGAFSAELRDVELEALGALAKRTIDETDVPYTRAMDRLAIDELALPLSKMSRSDLPRLMRLGRSDAAFPAGKLVPTAQALFRGLGFELQGQKGLTLHTASLPRKNALTVCFPVEVPTDVRVSVKPAAGAEALRDLLHELAHAEQALQVKRPEWEFRVLDGATAGEAWASLISGLVDDPAYIAEATALKGAPLATYVRNATARELLAVRHAAARVQLEVLLRTVPGIDPVETWRKVATRAFGFALTTSDAQRWVLEDSGVLAAADDLRGALLAAQVERALAAKAGARWWKSAATGELLRAAWADGTRATAIDVAASFGETEVTPAAMARTATARLEAK